MEAKKVLVFVGKNYNSIIKELFVEYINNNKNNQYIFCSNSVNVLNEYKSYLHDVKFVLIQKSNYSKKEKIAIHLLLRFSFLRVFLKNKVEKIFLKKIMNKINNLEFNKIMYLYDTNIYSICEFSSLNCNKEFINIDSKLLFNEKLNKNYSLSKKVLKSNFKEIYTLSNNGLSNEILYNQAKFTLLSYKIRRNKSSFSLRLIIKCQSNFNILLDKLRLKIGDLLYVMNVKKINSNYYIDIDLDYNIIINLPTQNKFILVYEDEQCGTYEFQINYSEKKGKYHKSKIYDIDGKTCFYLRQSKFNKLYLTVRQNNRTDHFIENLKINLGYFLSKIYKKNIYLLYEKDASRYEESASVLYERLIDEGYNNAYFILDCNSSHYSNINEKYKKNIIKKYSFKHYLYFFISKNFFGSELMVHAMELRIMNKYVLQKIDSTDNNFVFLQHGVMYMISLDSESRKYFNPRKDGKGKFRVVTSSKEEAKHFVDLGGYENHQLLITGLPKYDRNVLYNSANKIVVMPTWRLWEYNQATTDFRLTPYYKMLERIEKSIDDIYKDKLIILPHPLFYKAAENNDFPLKKYMKFNVKYDEILRETKILITDYSSIAYDAFYRGCNVIFYWEELEECLSNYGKNTKLMLNKDNVFGDICYNVNDLKNNLDRNYNESQLEIYKERYNKLVEFHDGKNTDRLIKLLIKERILK